MEIRQFTRRNCTGKFNITFASNETMYGVVKVKYNVRTQLIKKLAIEN